mgnify:CR=1 FL=1
MNDASTTVHGRHVQPDAEPFQLAPTTSPPLQRQPIDEEYMYVMSVVPLLQTSGRIVVVSKVAYILDEF